jgi:translation elongation factor EF-Tu-like GTPase
MQSFAEVLVEFLPPEEGGRKSPVVLHKDAAPHYRPHFVVRDDGFHANDENRNLGVEFVDGPVGTVPTAERVRAIVRLVYDPQVSYAALVDGATFDICEGGRTVGTGVVVRRYCSTTSV